MKEAITDRREGDSGKGGEGAKKEQPRRTAFRMRTWRGKGRKKMRPLALRGKRR
jgi:hypothetical protein